MARALEANLFVLDLHFLLVQDVKVVDWMTFLVRALLNLDFDLDSLCDSKDLQGYAFDRLLESHEVTMKSYLNQQVPLSVKHLYQF